MPYLGVLLFFYFFFYGYGDHRDLPSSPTRRSSDLPSPALLHSLASGWPSATPAPVWPREVSSEETVTVAKGAMFRARRSPALVGDTLLGWRMITPARPQRNAEGTKRQANRPAMHTSAAATSHT